MIEKICFIFGDCVCVGSVFDGLWYRVDDIRRFRHFRGGGTGVYFVPESIGKSSFEDKVNRLTAIEYEQKNAEICDYVVHFESYDDAVQQLLDILRITETAEEKTPG